MGAKGYILLFYSLMHNVHLGTKVVDRWNGHRQSILLLNVLVNGLMRQVPIAFNIDTKRDETFMPIFMPLLHYTYLLYF